jgi:hypothetical protein
MSAHRCRPPRSGRRRRVDLSVTERLADHTLILPLYHQLEGCDRERTRFERRRRECDRHGGEIVLIGASGLPARVIAVRCFPIPASCGVLDDDLESLDTTCGSASVGNLHLLLPQVSVNCVGSGGSRER